MMKQKFKNPNRAAEPVTQDKLCNHTVSQSAEKMITLNIYWLAYSYPFVSIPDLSLVFNELRKAVKSWFLNKREIRNIYKKKINETI